MPSRRSRRPSTARLGLLAVLLAALLTLTGCTSAHLPFPLPTSWTRTSLPDPVGAAADLLETLPVKGRAPKTGYDRDEFGQRWADVDGNGCDTRDDVLRRDLEDVALRAGTDGCTVETGVLHGPYTGDVVPFTAGPDTSADVQIDHVVALSAAWQTGAQQLDADARERLANDPLNLLAVDGAVNRSKSDGDAATWLPPNKAYRCPYVARQVAVKAKYGLWITQAEHDAVARVLAGCPGQTVPDAAARGSSVTAATGSPTPHGSGSASAPTTTAPAYPGCAAARSAGAAPLRRGEPGYAASMDGDGDGVACE